VLTDEDRAVIVQAADDGNLEAVRLMLDLGFPVNARGGDDGSCRFTAAAGAGQCAAGAAVDRSRRGPGGA
jgi:hypothetical protein